MVKVIVNGENGKIGREIVKAIIIDQHIGLVGQTGRHDNLGCQIKLANAKTVVDFTHQSTDPGADYLSRDIGIHPCL
jgi:dihydrodipicolinate reductase